jgi:voltage-gated potassium channel
MRRTLVFLRNHLVNVDLKGFTVGGALRLIVATTAGITVTAGVLMWVVNREAYPNVGVGLWWALQTVTTVGYGDRLPTNGAGYATAAVVMLTGIAFLSVMTATVTAAFLEGARRRLGAADDVARLREEVAALRRELAGADGPEPAEG